MSSPHQHLNPRRPKRLIRRSRLRMSSPALVPRLHLLLAVRRERGTRDALIRIRRLLDTDLLVRRLAAAAAHAEEPEESARHADGQHLAAHGRLDVVGLEHGVEDAGEHDVDRGRGYGGRENEYGLGLRGVVSICVCEGQKGRESVR
jgi:hypothetical protein